MSDEKSSTGKVRFINPPNTLKIKVGTGGLNDATIKRSQSYINDVKVDFAPYAKQYLEELEKQSALLQKGAQNNAELKEKIIAPIMQLKAHGGMFKYQLLSDVADIALQFLEAINEINDDASNILNAHKNTMKIIVKNNLTGNGGSEGGKLIRELDKACKRYFLKHKKNSAIPKGR
ncbi:MAG: hypothetical protein KAJ86_00685 [Alphaproteobacteria bacterium]|nr:hypothetical protein [Alphaproteobacteria bacterium]